MSLFGSGFQSVASPVLYPGAVRTEFIEEQAAKGVPIDLASAQSTLFVGRTVAALVTAPWLPERSGTIQWVDALADELGVVDE
jgi:hypothetical protein